MHIGEEYINRHHVICITIEEWDDPNEPKEFPFRLNLELTSNISKVFELSEREMVDEIVQRLNGTWHPPIPHKGDTNE